MDYAKYELDWNNSLTWPSGTLSQTFSNVNNSGTEFSFQFSGNTSNLSDIGSVVGITPNIQDYFTDGSTKSLSNYIDPGFSAGGAIQVVVSIDPPIPAQIGLELYHVNASASSGDKVQVYAIAVADGAKIYPTLTALPNSASDDLTARLGGFIDDQYKYQVLNTSGHSDQVSKSFQVRRP
ncbi:MAG: hypothetical protein AB8H47_08935 [Bacteroidia bacterium]